MSTQENFLDFICDSKGPVDQSTNPSSLIFKEDSIFGLSDFNTICEFKNIGSNLAISSMSDTLKGVLSYSFVIQFSLKVQSAQDIEIFRLGDISFVYRYVGDPQTGTLTTILTIKDKSYSFDRTFLNIYVSYQISLEVYEDRTIVAVKSTQDETIKFSQIADYHFFFTEFSRDETLYFLNSTKPKFDTKYYKIFSKYDCSELNNCNWNGGCVSTSTCVCNEGYEGEACDSFKCGDFWNNETLVCSNSGRCISHDICDCNKGYHGDFCESSGCEVLGKLEDPWKYDDECNIVCIEYHIINY